MSKVTDELVRMETDITNPDMWTREQADEWANAYWAIRWDKALTEEQQAAKIAEHSKLFRPVRKVHVNERGNTVIRRNHSTERYRWDFDDDFRKDGWLQFDTDQDAWYFGVWVNPRTFRTFSYAEGDMTLVICPDAAHYNAEIEDACKFYGEGFEMIACNMEAAQAILLHSTPGPDAEMDVCRQDRTKFFAVV
jgi:hypothetical protein